MFSQAFALYRRRFWALALSSALALLPANLLMVGALRFGVTRLDGTGIAETGTPSEQVREKKRDQEEKLPPPEEQPERARQVTREALQAGSKSAPAESKSASPLLGAILPIAYAVVVTAGILLFGLALAQAALVPLVLGRAHRPAGACAAVASRFGPLLWTGLLAGGLVAVGSLFCLVPGIVLALGLSFAVPVTMEEGLSGRAALERSWELMRDSWGQVLLTWLLSRLHGVGLGRGAAGSAGIVAPVRCGAGVRDHLSAAAFAAGAALPAGRRSAAADDLEIGAGP